MIETIVFAAMLVVLAFAVAAILAVRWLPEDINDLEEGEE